MVVKQFRDRVPSNRAKLVYSLGEYESLKVAESGES